MHSLYEQKIISKELVDHVMHTQFRSFEFLPRVASWLTEGQEIPFEKYDLKEVPDAPHAIWWIDNFGNVKTTLFPEEVDFKAGNKVILKKDLELTCYNRLKDVPEKKPALIIGSSGLGDKRFLEIVVQGVSAQNHFKLKPGQEI
jgi:S-adenosylmethionine hydrolase